MTKWIERYRRQAEERYRRLDDVLRACPTTSTQPHPRQERASHDHHHPPDTEIIVDKDVPLVRIIREFDAPPEKVFRAHTDPELIVSGSARATSRWRSTSSTAAPVASTATSTAARARSTASTAASTRCARTSSSCRPSPSRACPPRSVEKLVLEDLGNGRTRLVATSLVDSFEDRDAFVASGMETGVVQGYERLDDLLAGVIVLEVGFRGGVGGKKDSMASSARVMSSAVPNVASVLKNEPLPSTGPERSGRGVVGGRWRAAYARGRSQLVVERLEPARGAGHWRCKRVSRWALNSARLMRGASGAPDDGRREVGRRQAKTRGPPRWPHEFHPVDDHRGVGSCPRGSVERPHWCHLARRAALAGKWCVARREEQGVAVAEGRRGARRGGARAPGSASTGRSRRSSDAVDTTGLDGEVELAAAASVPPVAEVAHAGRRRVLMHTVPTARSLPER